MRGEPQMRSHKMASKNVPAIVSGAGLVGAIIDGLMKAAKRANLPDKAIHQLSKPESDGLFDKIVEILAAKTDNLLDFLGTITIPPTTEKFVAGDHFTRECFDFGKNFLDKFLGKVEEPRGSVTLQCHRIRKRSRDLAIISELGGEERAEIALADFSWLMEKQKNGEKGALLVDGRANTFYVRDVDEVLCPVGAYHQDRGRWYCDAGPLGNNHECFEGDRIFSRNSPVP